MREEAQPIQPLVGQKYINPDEERFRGAKYPRDNEGYKILPWQWIDPLDFRGWVKNFHLNTIQENFSYRGIDFKGGANHVFQNNHTLKSKIWPQFAKIADFEDNKGTLFQNAAIEFTQYWTYLFSLRVALKASSIWTSFPVVFAIMPINKYWADGVKIRDFIVTKSTTWMRPGMFVYDVGQGVANIKRWEKFLTYIYVPKGADFTASEIEITTDIVKLS